MVRRTQVNPMWGRVVGDSCDRTLSDGSFLVSKDARFRAEAIVAQEPDEALSLRCRASRRTTSPHAGFPS